MYCITQMTFLKLTLFFAIKKSKVAEIIIEPI